MAEVFLACFCLLESFRQNQTTTHYILAFLSSNYHSFYSMNHECCVNLSFGPMQIVFLCFLPSLIKEEKIGLIIATLLLILLFQYLPKVYHSICVLRRMQKVTGYIFGTIWWGFGLNLIAYFMASHVST